MINDVLQCLPVSGENSTLRIPSVLFAGLISSYYKMVCLIKEKRSVAAYNKL